MTFITELQLGVPLVLTDQPSFLLERDLEEKVLMVKYSIDLVVDVKDVNIIIAKKNKSSPTQQWDISTTSIHFF